MIIILILYISVIIFCVLVFLYLYSMLLSGRLAPDIGSGFTIATYYFMDYNRTKLDLFRRENTYQQVSLGKLYTIDDASLLLITNESDTPISISNNIVILVTNINNLFSLHLIDIKDCSTIIVYVHVKKECIGNLNSVRMILLSLRNRFKQNIIYTLAKTDFFDSPGIYHSYYQLEYEDEHSDEHHDAQ